MSEVREARGLTITALITDSFGGYGGIAKFNADLLRALQCSSHVARVHVLSRLMPITGLGTVPERVVFDRAAAGGKAAFARRVIAHAVAGPSSDVVICGHVNLLPLAWLIARRQQARLALVIHGIEAWAPHRSPLVRALARRVQMLVAVSHYSRARFESWSGNPERVAFVLPNTVDLSTFVPQARNDALAARYGLGDSPVLLTVARLAAGERYKGIDEVLDALPVLRARRPELRYLIVGDGDDQARLAAKAAALGLEQAVVFAGRVSEAEKVAHFALANAYVMPSTGEGFGIVFIEAAACGLPVIGSNADGSREALLDGRLGRLVKPGDATELIAAIEAALNEPGPRERRPEVSTFGWEAFRSRVDDWSAQMAAAGRKAS